MQRSDVLSRRQSFAALASPTALVATGVGLAALPAEPDAALRDLLGRWQRKTAELDTPSCGRTDEELDALLGLGAWGHVPPCRPSASRRGGCRVGLGAEMCAGAQNGQQPRVHKSVASRFPLPPVAGHLSRHDSALRGASFLDTKDDGSTLATALVSAQRANA